MKSSSPNIKSKQTALVVKEPIELMPFLGIHFNGKSRTALKLMLARKQVCVNSKPVTQYNYQLNAGDRVTLNTGKVAYELKHPKLKIVHEDDYLIVVEKAEGLLAVATDERKNEITAFSILNNYLKKKDPRNRLFVVHRIDRETSGLIMFAKSREVQLALQDNWHNAVTERVYVAVVEGVPERSEDTIVSYLRESKAYKIHSSHSGDDGKEAITHYRITRRTNDYALLRVELETGRKNQIRVHMQEIGHPIIGDKKYGAPPSPIGRMGLHARSLAFIHPVTHENMRFETPIPRKFSALFVVEKEK
ncbi:MAG: RluA family pseudouridine synthase [Prevotellaceae bacterium]|jgi:23S rRNA pseudouridine1911/1915/1917 synthase|nr:RluA family pseudouridine synthase [Prevotellaceae bacterium]